MTVTKVCLKCNQSKPVQSFQPKGGGKRRAVCRSCFRRARRTGMDFVTKYAGKDENHRICRICNSEKAISEFAKNKNKKITYRCLSCSEGLCYRGKPVLLGYKQCQQCSDKVKARKLRIRQLVISHYGGKCAFCDCDELIFLTIDHVRGGGNTHRKEAKDPNICSLLYREFRKTGQFPIDYQVLCWSCNSAKHLHGVEAVKAAIARMRTKYQLSMSCR